MAEFFFDYGLFALKAITIVVAILIVVVGSIAAGMRNKKSPEGHIEVKKINDDIKDIQEALRQAVSGCSRRKSTAATKSSVISSRSRWRCSALPSSSLPG